MASATTSAAKITSSSLRPLIRSLPASPLSAESVQLSDALESIAEKALASSSISSSTSGSATSNGSSASSSSTSTPNSMEALRIAGHQRRISQMRDSLVRIRNGNAMNAYPLTGHTLSPPNDPHYYTRFRNGVRNAEKGIQRPWWKIFFNIKGEE
ncbi:uncharacterized protein I303_100515 [Kwoniella dejecticola CBS 10117]|uniref:Uncharacterized protein n=1 Tax=Kwoniella dejecticola CBS 10117 TaxID=1296121 RepID=A0A1A6AF94_9TREE|nr:uncharacterized protein I303_00515 [Kwoniella dejecticola CBS 10117]OBR88698.1 hypothetical protein I303_00515 [Kwoniella dejecticola CBS 10117]